MPKKSLIYTADNDFQVIKVVDFGGAEKAWEMANDMAKSGELKENHIEHYDVAEFETSSERDKWIMQQVKESREARKAVTIDSFFPNGFTSWHETHAEITAKIALESAKDKPTGKVAEVQEAKGMGGLYELAETLTDEFEKIYEGFEWDGEFYDEVDAFCLIKLFQPEKNYYPITNEEK